jgi:hypothetical protein
VHSADIGGAVRGGGGGALSFSLSHIATDPAAINLLGNSLPIYSDYKLTQGGNPPGAL